MSRFEKTETAAALPGSWDSLAPSYFQQREFLSYAERYNTCRQRYYTLSDGGMLRSGCIVYSLRLDLLTFLRIRSPIPMHILGVPVGTATAGYFGEAEARDELLDFVAGQERGMLVILNVEPSDELKIGIRCRMLPTILFHNPFASWADYLAALRSSHRRRVLQIEHRSKECSRIVTDCSAFTRDHHLLYRQVHDRASAKLETLSCEFFRHLPIRFRLASYYKDGRLLSWTITVHDGTMFMYFFGGMDYADVRQSRSYLIGLENIVRECIEGGYPLLDLGQTADQPKMRFGGVSSPRDMYLTHSCVLVRGLFRWSHPLLEYRGRVPAFSVFTTPAEKV